MVDDIKITHIDPTKANVQRFSGLLCGLDLALEKILRTDDLFHVQGKWLCDFWMWVR